MCWVRGRRLGTVSWVIASDASAGLLTLFSFNTSFSTAMYGMTGRYEVTVGSHLDKYWVFPLPPPTDNSPRISNRRVTAVVNGKSKRKLENFSSSTNSHYSSQILHIFKVIIDKLVLFHFGIFKIIALNLKLLLWSWIQNFHGGVTLRVFSVC